MKKTSKTIMALLVASPFAFAQTTPSDTTVESYSDNNIEYPSFDTGTSATEETVFDPSAYVLETLETPDYSTAPEFTETDTQTPEVNEILPSVNPAESYFLTSSSGGALETYGDKDLQTPSRSVTIAQNQYLDVEYPGKGWIYLGETDNTTLLRYFGHSLASDTVFTLRSKSQGTALLHFYKIDPLTGNSINDYLEVVVSGKTASQEHVVAPSYKDLVPSGQRKKGQSQTEQETVDVEPEMDSNGEIQDDISSLGDSIEAASVETVDSPIGLAGDMQKTEVAEEKHEAVQSAKTTDVKSSSTSTTSSTRSTTSSTTKPSSTSTSASSSSSRTTASTTSRTTETRPSSSASTRTTSSTVTTESKQSSPSSTSSSIETSTADARATQADTQKKVETPSRDTNRKNMVIGSEADNELLAKAQSSYDKGQYGECLDYLTDFFNNAVTKIDEGLYLQGRALEAPSESRNIKAALDTYETLVKRYPQSKKWKAANERVIYIKRFYFNIR